MQQGTTVFYFGLRGYKIAEVSFTYGQTAFLEGFEDKERKWKSI